MALKTSSSGLVYSSEAGRMCPACRQAKADCACRAAKVVQGDGLVRVSRETKGRGGKTVTLVKGLALNAEALAELAKQLRSACGAGGTVKDGVVQVQGEHLDTLLARLQKLGYAAKKSGS